MSDLINGRTPEEIKRNLSWLVRCNNCPQNHEYGCDYENRTKECQTTDDALALIERLEAERDAALAKVPKWISVEERLPEKHQVVLFYIPWNKSCMIGWIDEGGGINLEGYGKCYDFSLVKPSHWMPLPSTEGLK